eukprot:4889097-Pyramimonas_sp.AAC.1
MGDKARSFVEQSTAQFDLFALIETHMHSVSGLRKWEAKAKENGYRLIANAARQREGCRNSTGQEEHANEG